MVKKSETFQFEGLDVTVTFKKVCYGTDDAYSLYDPATGYVPFKAHVAIGVDNSTNFHVNREDGRNDWTSGGCGYSALDVVRDALVEIGITEEKKRDYELMHLIADKVFELGKSQILVALAAAELNSSHLFKGWLMVSFKRENVLVEWATELPNAVAYDVITGSPEDVTKHLNDVMHKRGPIYEAILSMNGFDKNARISKEVSQAL